MPKPIFVDPLSAASLRVTPKFNEVELASATAFWVEWGGAKFLITNWHVVSGRNADTDECVDRRAASIPNSLAVRFHGKARLGSWVSFDLPLFDGDGARNWRAR